MLLLTPILAMLAALSASAATAEKITPRYPLSCVLKVIAEHQNVKLNPQVALPPVILESKSSLEQFQNAVEKQMGIRPGVFFNMYSLEKNEIYLIDEASIYNRLNSSIEDSLALLAAFYIQVKYQGIDPANPADQEYSNDLGMLMQAWYRSTYTAQNRSPCEN